MRRVGSSFRSQNLVLQRGFARIQLSEVKSGDCFQRENRWWIVHQVKSIAFFYFLVLLSCHDGLKPFFKKKTHRFLGMLRKEVKLHSQRLCFRTY
jgi:hypothetical protein